MNRIKPLASCLLAVFPLCAFQTNLPAGPWSKSTLARPGLHHVNISGRFLDDQNRPMQGVVVDLTTDFRSNTPLARGVSDLSGRVRFPDISIPEAARLRWVPPDGWLSGSRSLRGESLQDVDLGDVRLEREAVLRVAVELLGGDPADQGSHITVVLEGGNRGPRFVAEKQGPFYILRQVALREGRWEVSVQDKTGHASYSGPARIEPGRQDQLFVIRLLRDTVKGEHNYDRKGQLEVSQVLVPAAVPEPERRARGRVLAPDGSPALGGSVQLQRFMGRGLTQWARLDDSGRFDVRYTAPECQSPVLFLGHPNWTETRLAEKGTCEAWVAGQEVKLKKATRLNLIPKGLEPGRVQALWWHEHLGWQPFGTLQPWIPLNAYRNRPLVALTAEGFVPAVQELQIPDAPDKDGAPPPPPRFDAEFALDPQVVRQLMVRAGPQPLPDAIVDLEWIRDLRADRRLALGTWRTGKDGTLRLAGTPDQLVEVFVYSRGYEPARAIWQPGAPLTVRLAPRRTRLLFPRLRPGSVARVRRVSQTGAVYTVEPEYGEQPELRVAPGEYDVTFFSINGQATSNQRVRVAAGETKSIDTEADARPTLVVRYPGPGWSADVSDSAPAGMAFGWAIYSVVGGQASFHEPAAMLQSESSQEAVFRLTRAGRFHVQVQRDGLEGSWWREVEVAPGATVTVEVPRPSATLRGSMRTYDGGLGFSHHGWAGPRMQLISDDPQGWSVTVFLPPREAKVQDNFTLTGLPPGSYHLHQHLIGERRTYRDSKGTDVPYTVPIDAWGGIQVQLAAGATATLKDFADYPFRDLTVQVSDGAGSPAGGATLRVRDRMSEAWRQVAEGPTTLSNASHPIPYPPAVRLQGGKATLPSIRAGRLELQVELDSGQVYPFSTEVDPSRPLSLRLPVDGGRR